MKFNIVDRDTGRVVGSVGIDEHQLLRSLEDRNDRRGQTDNTGEAKIWPDLAEQPRGYANANANRLWRYDSWLHEVDRDKSSSFGDFRRLPYNYGVERVPVKIESVQGSVPKVQYSFIAFHTMTEATSPEFSEYQSALKWVLADAKANPENVKDVKLDFESFISRIMNALHSQLK
jgi:hypothetical protein